MTTALTKVATSIVRAGEVVRRGWTGDGEGTPRFLLNVPWNFFQVPVYRSNNGGNAAVEACVSAISQTVAMLPVGHWRDLDNGGRERITTSPAARVLHKPNPYQTRADFILNLLRCELLKGKAYAIATRDGSARITALHPIPYDHAKHFVARETGDIFYNISPPDMVALDPREWNMDRVLPARDVLHMRLHCPRDPLEGETPLVAAALAVEIGNSIMAHEAAFFANMSRPSGVIETDLQLTSEQTQELRTRWQEHSQGGNAGGTPILSWGLKWKPLTMNAVDAQIIDAYKLSKVDIAGVFRVPPIVIGVESGATYNNTEQLMRNWHATGLGFVIDHLELSLSAMFGLPPDEYIEFDIDYLLRSDFVARIEALTKGVIGGIYSPNEARAKEGLAKVDHGDEPRLQAQVVPLSAYYEKPQTAPTAPTPGGAPLAVAANDPAPQLPAPKAAAEVKQFVIEETKRIDLLHAELATLAEQLAELKNAEPVRGPPGAPGGLHLAQPFEPGTLYEAATLVRHKRRYWFAREATDSEPGTTNKWVLQPLAMVYCGPFDATAAYYENDIVIGPQGAQWIAEKTIAPGGDCPGDGWALYLKQGKRGPGVDEKKIGELIEAYFRKRGDK